MPAALFAADLHAFITFQHFSRPDLSTDVSTLASAGAIRQQRGPIGQELVSQCVVERAIVCEIEGTCASYRPCTAVLCQRSTSFSSADNLAPFPRPVTCCISLFDQECTEQKQGQSQLQRLLVSLCSDRRGSSNNAAA